MQQVETKNANFQTVVGAEATIDLIDYYGRIAIKKARIRKEYRSLELDSKLRSRRTKEEAQILHVAKLAGLDSPAIYFVDPVKGVIIMEFLEGRTLKEIATTLETASNSASKETLNLFFRLGQSIQRLHSKDIIHGDLTTKNVIVSQERRRLAVVDFGLSFISQRIEDRAEDLHLMKQALTSTLSSKFAKRSYAGFLQGYSETLTTKSFEKIRNQISEIERRGRYAIVD